MMDERKLAELCAQKCLEKKGENVVILDLENRSSVADYFVICSGYSDRQVSAIAENVAQEIGKAGVKALSREGMVDGRWALIDFGSVIVHVFRDQMRDFYSLESLWQDAPRINVQEEEEKSTRFDPGYDSGSARF
jgi:ribosome-associated protein